MPTRKRQVVLFAFEGMQLLDMVGPSDVFDAATRLLGGLGGYRVLVASVDGQPVRGSAGVRVVADTALAHVRPGMVDTLIVGGGMQFEEILADTRLAPALGRLADAARRTCSVCTGAFLLAGAGLLEGRTATTHWAFCDELARRHPGVRVEPDRIFIRDGHITTSAGVTAGMDLALALVEEDHGSEVARAVARWTVMFVQRPGGQSQFSERLELPVDLSPSIRDVLNSIVAEPSGDHRLAALARRAALSERHLRRVFAKQTKTTPARFVERVRVEAARELLEGTTTPVDVVADRCGFGSPETMRRAFLRVLSVGPAEYRMRFRSPSPREHAA
jgi:transcriptional regulator GlxA family with amidase domain